MLKKFLVLRESKVYLKLGFFFMHNNTDKISMLLQKVFISFGCKTVVSTLCLKTVDGFTLYQCVCVKPLKLQMLFRGI